MVRIIRATFVFFLFLTPALGGNQCDLVHLSIDNHQFDPEGAFVGNTLVTFLEVDQVTGSITPTGRSLNLSCSVTLLAFKAGLEYVTTHRCVGGPGSRIDFTSLHEGQFIPLAGDPEFAFGVLDNGSIIQGSGRWNCGTVAVGLEPLTQDFNARVRLWDPTEPGRFLGTARAKWCSCGR